MIREKKTKTHLEVNAKYFDEAALAGARYFNFSGTGYKGRISQMDTAKLDTTGKSASI